MTTTNKRLFSDLTIEQATAGELDSSQMLTPFEQMIFDKGQQSVRDYLENKIEELEGELEDLKEKLETIQERHDIYYDAFDTVFKMLPTDDKEKLIEIENIIRNAISF